MPISMCYMQSNRSPCNENEKNTKGNRNRSDTLIRSTLACGREKSENLKMQIHNRNRKLPQPFWNTWTKKTSELRAMLSVEPGDAFCTTEHKNGKLSGTSERTDALTQPWRG
ncbi:hypothetical protein CBL_00565 [Carabus blaptoides fortunei]